MLDQTKKKIGIGLIVVAVGVLGFGGFKLVKQIQEDQKIANTVVPDTSSYEAIIQQYYEAVQSKDAATMKNLVATPSYWDYYMETYDKTEEDVLATLEDGINNTLEEWSDTYGPDVVISYQIVGMSEQGQDGIDEWNDYMEGMLGSTDSDISDSVMLQLNTTYTSDDGEETVTTYPTLGKAKTGWFIMSEDTDLSDSSSDSDE